MAVAAALRRGSAPLRRPAGWVLLAGVTLAHLLLSAELVNDRFGWGRGERPPPRIEVAFVRELAQAAPPAAAPRPAAPAERRLAAVAAAPPMAPAASGPASAPRAATEPAPSVAAALPPVEPPRPAPSSELPPAADATSLAVVPAAPPIASPGPPAPAPEPMPSLPTSPASPALAAAPPPAGVPSTAPTTAPNSTATPRPLSAASAATAPSFDWPPSTRLTYTLNGFFRGPIEGGTARVEWLRAGSRYQVRLEASVGFTFSRSIVSEGELTARGLLPRRFDGEQKLLFRAPRRWSQQFSADKVTLGDGREVDALPGVQDEASQFVQLTWLFTVRPELLRVGQSIEMPLAINRRLDRWTYDVKEVQTLNFSFGAVETYYVKPRREAKGGDMTAEIWFAPSLQYLPVRILIRQEGGSHIDLTLDKPPLQAER